MKKKLGGKLYGPRLYGLRPFDGCHFLGYLDGLRSFHVGDRWARILCMISCEEPPLMGFEFGQIQRAFFHVLGLALMLGRLVVLWPFCGLSSRKEQDQVFICRTFFDGSCRLGSFIRALLGHPVGQCV